MKSLKRCAATLMLSAVLGLSLVGLAQAGVNAPSGTYNRSATSNNNPYNSAIRRANPNSRQGTQSTVPANRSNLQSNPRPPTLENGGIGNGIQNRQPALSAPPTPSSAPNRNVN